MPPPRPRTDQERARSWGDARRGGAGRRGLGVQPGRMAYDSWGGPGLKGRGLELGRSKEVRGQEDGTRGAPR